MTISTKGLAPAPFAPPLAAVPEGQTLSLRYAANAAPGRADGATRDLFGDPVIAYLHAHDAAQGCFIASLESAR